MTDRNYIDIEGMRKQAAENSNKQQADMISRLQGIEKDNEKGRENTKKLFEKYAQVSTEQAEKSRATEIESEKAKAIEEIEAKYERQGIKSEATKQTDAAYKQMLNDLLSKKN